MSTTSGRIARVRFAGLRTAASVACVADRLGMDRFELRRSEHIQGRSCNGNGSVLLEVLEDMSVEKDVVQRDIILQRAAADPALLRRASAQMSTWANLVDAVARRVRR